jgi:hypothetical protein
MRESPAMPILERADRRGARVRAFDPAAMGRRARSCRRRSSMCDDSYDAPTAPTARDRHRVERVPRSSSSRLHGLLAQPLIVDLRNLYEPAKLRAGFRYVSVGRPEVGRREPRRGHRRRRLPRLPPLRAPARRRARGRRHRQLVTGRARTSLTCSDRRLSLVEHDVSEPITSTGRSTTSCTSRRRRARSTTSSCPIQTLKVGSLGTHNALGLARAKGARYLLASTSEVYGDPLVHPQPESYWGNVNPVGPRGVYDEAKRFAEAMTMAYHRVHGVDTRIVRIFNTYGPRMRLRDGRVVPNFIQQALAASR